MLSQRIQAGTSPSVRRTYSSIATAAQVARRSSVKPNTQVDVLHRFADAFRPYLIVAIGFGIQYVISQVTTSWLNLILMVVSILVEASLVRGWSHQRYSELSLARVNTVVHEERPSGVNRVAAK